MGLESQSLANKKNLIAALLALLSLLGCDQPLQSPAAPPRNDTPSLIFEGFKARGSFKGIKQWEAVATRARVYNSTQSASAEEVAITYFQAGKPVSHARADHADIDLKNYDIVADGNVLVRAQNGVLLSTDKLSWDNATQEVHTHSAVKVWRGHSVLTGRGLIADRRLEKVEVQEDVKVEAANVQELRKLRSSVP
jgi:LPS export ABC transporter protein LptC